MGLALPARSGGRCMTRHGRKHAFHSHWCVLLEFHLKRLRLSASAFATRVGRSQQIVNAYLVGRAKPPLDQMEIWAAMLSLRGAEREQFVLAAYEAWTPERIWRRLLELEARKEPAIPRPASPDLEWAVIADLVALLKDVEALFYTRTVPHEKIPALRVRVGAAIRTALERHDRPPPPGSGTPVG